MSSAQSAQENAEQSSKIADTVKGLADLKETIQPLVDVNNSSGLVRRSELDALKETLQTLLDADNSSGLVRRGELKTLLDDSLRPILEALASRSISAGNPAPRTPSQVFPHPACQPDQASSDAAGADESRSISSPLQQPARDDPDAQNDETMSEQRWLEEIQACIDENDALLA